MSISDPPDSARARVRIDVFSDTICPWCWIGKRRLERTLEARPDLDAATVWHAFQLNPTMPAEGMDRQKYLDAKFGGTHHARAVYGRVIAESARESLPFDFGAIPRTPNTLDSHRLVRWAAGQPLGQTAMVEALFDAYFAKGQDVGDVEVLARVAVAAGYDESDARDLLAGDEGRDEVTARTCGRAVQESPAFHASSSTARWRFRERWSRRCFCACSRSTASESPPRAQVDRVPMQPKTNGRRNSRIRPSIDRKRKESDAHSEN